MNDWECASLSPAGSRVRDEENVEDERSGFLTAGAPADSRTAPHPARRTTMNVHLPRGVSPVSIALALTCGLLAGGRAEGFSPAITHVQQTTAYNAGSPKVARAVCPAGQSVLGGGALITGGQGVVAIQAAFPTHDDAIFQDVYIVKAAAEEGSTDSWSVTAEAFCTASTVTTKVFESSLFDSTPIKQVT